MIYILALFILACGYYTLTYGISLWRVEGKRLAGAGAAAIALVGTIVPIVVLYLKQ